MSLWKRYWRIARIAFPHILIVLLIASCTSTADEALVVSTPALTHTSGPEPTVEDLAFTPSPVPPRQTLTAAGFTALAMPILAEDMFFVDEKRGWILGIRPVDQARTLWEFALARTSDGGASWSAIPMQLPVSWQQGLHSGIFFADEQRGWLFMSQFYPSIMSTLYTTRDGGQSWQEEASRGAIVEISRALNGEIWALELYEDPSAWRFLMITEAGYDAWYESKLSPPLDLPPYDIILQDQSHAWFSEWIPRPAGEGLDAQVYDLGILFSADSGRNWEMRGTPCGGFLGGTEFNASLVGVGESHLWLGCGQAAGAGSGTKFVYFSSDGGRTWENRGSSEDDSLSSGGGYFRGLDALSDDFVYMNWRRSQSVMLTRDGGKTWDDLYPACFSESIAPIFMDQHTGWAYANTWDFEHICLSRTMDGGRTWQCRILPEDEPCDRP